MQLAERLLLYAWSDHVVELFLEFLHHFRICCYYAQTEFEQQGFVLLS